jgi:hypothetical protein
MHGTDSPHFIMLHFMWIGRSINVSLAKTFNNEKYAKSFVIQW